MEDDTILEMDKACERFLLIHVLESLKNTYEAINEARRAGALPPFDERLVCLADFAKELHIRINAMDGGIYTGDKSC